ncbi:helix-turn-helix domain-containing protein [Brevibacillus borstelensis]|uniref:helix-turn-helix domain-containing protein n=1 Tax=Brevibacillus borstelensis TaxID=45462 RepID=UPI00287F80F3|nr:helix-turn-helix transcriptional regulator [Brevibacillus borstelensis]WNF08377.1 helix-turn-helix transcriptional regulator [Brevibacillus borstelensis]
MICPVCTKTMKQRKQNLYFCYGCGAKLEQLTFDSKDKQNLITARIRAGFATVQEAADATGYNVSYLRGLERGEKPVTPRTAYRLAAIYGCGISDLVDKNPRMGEGKNELST